MYGLLGGVAKLVSPTLKPELPPYRQRYVPKIVGTLNRNCALLIVNRRLLEPVTARPPWYTRSHGRFRILNSIPLRHEVRIWVILAITAPAAIVIGPVLMVPVRVYLHIALKLLLVSVVRPRDTADMAPPGLTVAVAAEADEVSAVMAMMARAAASMPLSKNFMVVCSSASGVPGCVKAASAGRGAGRVIRHPSVSCR